MEFLTKKMIEMAKQSEKDKKEKKDIFNPFLARMNKCPEKELSKEEKVKRKQNKS